MDMIKDMSLNVMFNFSFIWLITSLNYSTCKILQLRTTAQYLFESNIYPKSLKLLQRHSPVYD